jgi:hypothetical protein
MYAKSVVSQNSENQMAAEGKSWNQRRSQQCHTRLDTSIKADGETSDRHIIETELGRQLRGPGTEKVEESNEKWICLRWSSCTSTNNMYRWSLTLKAGTGDSLFRSEPTNLIWAEYEQSMPPCNTVHKVLLRSAANGTLDGSHKQPASCSHFQFDAANCPPPHYYSTSLHRYIVIWLYNQDTPRNKIKANRTFVTNLKLRENVGEMSWNLVRSCAPSTTPTLNLVGWVRVPLTQPHPSPPLRESSLSEVCVPPCDPVSRGPLPSPE